MHLLLFYFILLFAHSCRLLGREGSGFLSLVARRWQTLETKYHLFAIREDTGHVCGLWFRSAGRKA